MAINREAGRRAAVAMGAKVKPSDFTSLGKMLWSAKRVWKLPRVWPMAVWQGKTLVLTGKGELFLVDSSGPRHKRLAERVSAHPDVLVQIFDYHRQVSWWKDAAAK